MRLIPRLHNSSVTVRQSGVVSRPAARTGASPTRKAVSLPARGTLLAVLMAWLAVFVLLVVMPIAMLANGVEPEAILGWIAMVAVAMAVSWWSECRRERQWLKRHGKPKRENYPASAAFRAEHGTAERCAEAEKPAAASSREGFWWWPARWTGGEAKARREAPQVEEAVLCFVAFEGHDPRFLETRPYTVVDAVMDAHAEAEAAGLSREDVIEHMASALRGADRKPSSKASKQPVGRGGSQASRLRSGQGRVRGGAAGPRVEGGGPRGYLGG